jgi:hypothetical protein
MTRDDIFVQLRNTNLRKIIFSNNIYKFGSGVPCFRCLCESPQRHLFPNAAASVS